MKLQELLTRFNMVRRLKDNSYQCKCPAHDDKHASLTISEQNNKILLHCHAGCSTGSILDHVGLTFKDLHTESVADWKEWLEKAKNGKIEDIYNYLDEQGNYLYSKVRLKTKEGKRIIYGTIAGDRIKLSIGNTKKVLFNLKDIREAKETGKALYLPEGEKDCRTLKKKGFLAATYGAVGDWKKEFAATFEGIDLIVLPDNDTAGRKVADQIVKDCIAYVKSIKKVITSTANKGDVTNYFEEGHTLEEFQELIEKAEYISLQEQTATDTQTDTQTETVTDTAEKLDLSRFHHFNSKGNPIGVYDYEIFSYIKEHYPLCICGFPYLYSGGVYVPDRNGTKVKQLIRGLLYKEFIKSRIINQIYNLIIEAEELQKDFSSLNQYPKSYINFLDGMVDVKTMKKIPHSPTFYSINQVPYRYEEIEKAAAGKELESFFDFIFSNHDDRQMFLEYAGLCLTRDTSQQKFLTLCGLGGTGKSVLIRLLETAAGMNNVSNVSMQELNKRFSTSLLVGKTLNSCADLSVEALEDSSTIKKLLGEDSLMAEFKGENAFMFKNYSKLLFSTNMLPTITSERTNGFFRRLLILKMDRQPEHPDTELFSKLEKEILYFIKLSIEAVHRMYERGTILISENSKESVLQMRKDSDVVEAWLSDRCTISKEAKEERTSTFKDFEEYCEIEERQSLTRNNFFKALRTKNFLETKIQGLIYFKGLKLGKIAPSPDNFLEVSEEDRKNNPFL